MYSWTSHTTWPQRLPGIFRSQFWQGPGSCFQGTARLSSLKSVTPSNRGSKTTALPAVSDSLGRYSVLSSCWLGSVEGDRMDGCQCPAGSSPLGPPLKQAGFPSCWPYLHIPLCLAGVRGAPWEGFSEEPHSCNWPPSGEESVCFRGSRVWLTLPVF